MKMARHFGLGNKVDRERERMSITYLRAPGSDASDGFCRHAHTTVISAVACISSAGDYIMAQEDGVLRCLNQAEEAEYQYAIYGGVPDRSFAPMEGFRKKQFT